MNTQNEPIVFQDDEMIPIHLLNGSFEINKELMAVINGMVPAFGLSSFEDLKTITEEDFFKVFTPLMNEHYGLK
jgi:hypothetical protein